MEIELPRSIPGDVLCLIFAWTVCEKPLPMSGFSDPRVPGEMFERVSIHPQGTFRPTHIHFAARFIHDRMYDRLVVEISTEDGRDEAGTFAEFSREIKVWKSWLEEELTNEMRTGRHSRFAEILRRSAPH